MKLNKSQQSDFIELGRTRDENQYHIFFISSKLYIFLNPIIFLIHKYPKPPENNIPLYSWFHHSRLFFQTRIYFQFQIHLRFSYYIVQHTMPLVQGKYLLDGYSLTHQDLDTILQQNLNIDLTPSAWQKVAISRSVIHELMSQKNRVVYGINTGFGNFADKILSINQRSQLQNNLIRSHSVCVGNPVSNNTVKRMMILRINTLAKGRSGIDPKNLKVYIDACNKNYFPRIPEKGTVGASGDLAPLSHLALGMMGQGQAWSERLKKYTSARQIMDQLNLETLNLKQKQGLALINGTQFMVSIISEVISISKRIWESAIIIFAFSLQIFGFNLETLQDQIIDYYEKIQPHFGKTLRIIKSYLDNGSSELHQDRLEVKKNNSPLSITQGFQNISSLLQTINFCSRIINEQMNSATDNPLVYSKQDGFPENVLISAGNFHGQYVAKSADFLSMGLFSLGRFSQARIQRYVNDRISNLPGFLVKNGGLNSGYMILQYTSAALLSQSKVLSKPASSDSVSTSASQEDHVSMGGYAARKCREMLKNISYILGIELMCALQSISIIDKKPSQKLNKIFQNGRKYIRYVQHDEYYGPDIEIAKQLVEKGLNSLL